VIELNEAFAAQGLAVTRDLGLPDDAEHVNPNGGAIALGHPLGMSGARLVTTAIYELEKRQGRYALCTMCIGVGQGIAMVIERVGRSEAKRDLKQIASGNKIRREGGRFRGRLFLWPCLSRGLRRMRLLRRFLHMRQGARAADKGEQMPV